MAGEKIKTIRDPLTHKLVDVSDVIEIIDTPQFQRLGRIKQLGYANLVYRGANHTRFEHCIGVYDRTREYCRKFGLGPEVAVAGLTHDVLHSAFSHMGEMALNFYTKKSHDERLDHLYAMKDRIGERYDFKKIVGIFERKDPAWRVIWPILGTDKQDYICRDLNACGFPVVETAGFVEYSCYDKKEGICFDVKQSEWLMGFMESWWKAHQEIYFRKKNILVKEQLVRALYHALESGQLKEAELLDSYDSHVEEILFRSEKQVLEWIPSPKELMRGIIENRGGYSTVISIKNEGRGKLERKAGKLIDVAELSPPDIKKLEQRLEGVRIIEKEQEISEALGYHVLICPIYTIDRLIPKDVTLDLADEGRRSTLFAEFPKFKEFLLEKMSSHYATRIAVPEGKRKDAFGKSRQVYGILGLS